ncbi:putative PHD type zinc finger protein with BAH domain-containing protein [Neophaeococcomyces mojaviensis]|uniref:PHD type zinc finger protein with BAH domain-containing protein n=1 Tax=Neophaeococcomyces mojaviensis TaxID=3383035 RepID=A0ACC2ZWH8_9EURO|nr:putative PHD type zinc finger protein with BAH domain-containing protein [Knufia sp. JES_112]
MTSSSAALAGSESATHLGDPGRATTSNAPSPTAVSSDPSAAADPQAQFVPQSQPKNVTSSTASDLHNISGDDANVAGPYGTRSRNRPGVARPNYADDKEIDHEIEAAGRYQHKLSKKFATSTAAADMEQVPARNGFAAIDGAVAAANLEHVAPVSNGTNNTQPATTASKKRKQPGSSTTVSAPPPAVAKPSPPAVSRPKFAESNMLSFSDSRARLNNKEQLVADDRTTIQINDHMYFVCEPPGEPYYFGRIMEFLHVNNNANSPVEAVRVNWFYRPKDIQRRVQDTRVVFASMHSDTCPLTSMRGKCNIQHLADISDLDEYRKQKDSFWFDKLYDRYMHRYYEVIPTSKVVNVPRHVKKVLDERWRFVLVEVGRGRDLTSASKVCKRCTDFAANHNSVDCAVCKNTYHMQCVRPPLLRKPARGFAWACAACSRAQELKMEARNTPLSENELSRLAEAESFDDEEFDSPPQDQTTRENSTGTEAHPPPTVAQLEQANLWQWRYLGIHSKPEDALDYDDRIYPRASSRLGPRHQANVNVWHGRPVEFVKPAEAKKKYKPTISSKKDAKSVALAENDKREKRPKWVYDEPPGYVARGQDEPIELKGRKEYTAQLTFRMPDPSRFTERGLDDNDRPADYDTIVDDFMQRCDKEIAPLYNLGPGSVDVRTKGLEKLQENNYDCEKALEAMRHLSAKTDLKQPELTKEEIRRFEEGVAKYGSELHLVARHVSSTIKESRIVRFYYMWKKTPRGREIWGNYEGRKSKKDSKRVDKDGNVPKLLDDVADDADDSAFDHEKAARVKRGFACKFCNTRHSRIWRRAPATAPGTIVPRDPASKNAKDKSNWLVLALCGKCAYLWRRYAIQYESIEEIGKKIAIAGGRASKRKVDEELMRTVLEAHNFAGDILSRNTAQIVTGAGIEVPLTMVEADEPPKKKVKPEMHIAAPEVVVDKKKIVPEKPIELEPLKPEMPRVKEHPCAVCHILSDPDHKMLKCRDCRLHVHAPCYGVKPPNNGSGPWYCDMCKNDSTTQVSTNYECVLCPVRRTPQELMEPPKVSHKKKTDREREKERAEREMVQEAGRRWREDQLAAGRPVDPREPLKRTAWNNWVHVNCAVWTKEIRFGDAEHLDAAEGVGFIPKDRFETPCKFCKETGFPTVSCQFPACNANFHVGCAHQHGCILGFDISPVKMSRRDSVVVMKLDSEVGLAVPGIWCSHHSVPTIVHNMLEMTPSGLTALQQFAQTYKQVDNSITGTVRRAAQFLQYAPTTISSNQPTHRRLSTLNGNAVQSAQIEPVMGRNIRSSPSPLSPQANGDNQEISACSSARDARTVVKSEKKCCSCLITTSPKWWPATTQSLPKATEPEPQTTSLHQSSETISMRASNSVQPPSPELPQRQIPAVQPSSTSAASNIKAEPMDIDTDDVPEEARYQCHKCHVQKKIPPSSPSQVRQRERAPAESVQDLTVQQPTVGPGHINGPPLPSPLDTQGHAHPVVNGTGPPPAWQNGAAPWPGPPLRNSAPPPPHASVVYGAPSPYHHARPGEFGGYPFPNPPVHYPVPSALPPHTARPQPNGLLQHSPPPVGFAHPLSGPPPPGTPAGQPASPHMAAPAQRPYGSDSIHRPTDSPNMSYTGVRPYHQPHPVSGRPLSSTAEQADQTRRLSIPSIAGESPRMRYEGNGREETPIVIDGPIAPRDRDRRSSTAGPGASAASASPSLRNLLS